MQEQLEKLKDEFEGFEFVYQEAPHLNKKKHLGVEVSLVGDKFKIETDTRTFVVHHSDVETFMQKVVFTHTSENKQLNNTNSIEMATKPALKSTEVYVSEVCVNLSNGLLAMFNKIQSGNPTKKDLEQAKSMSDIAGKIIDVEKVKLGYLSLSKR